MGRWKNPEMKIITNKYDMLYIVHIALYLNFKEISLLIDIFLKSKLLNLATSNLATQKITTILGLNLATKTWTKVLYPQKPASIITGNLIYVAR